MALASIRAQANGLRRGPQTHTLAFCYPDRNLCEIRFYAGEVVAALPPAGPQGANGSTLVPVDPRSGVEVFTLVDITQSEPDPSLFAMPKNAHLIDYRTATVR